MFFTFTFEYWYVFIVIMTFLDARPWINVVEQKSIQIHVVRLLFAFLVAFPNQAQSVFFGNILISQIVPGKFNQASSISNCIWVDFDF